MMKSNKPTNDKYKREDFIKEFYYFAGLFASDGGFHGKHTMRICIKNEGARTLLEKLAEFFGHNNVRAYALAYYEINVTSEELAKMLVGIGIPRERKTYELRSVKIPSREALMSFLCGYMDGDG